MGVEPWPIATLQVHQVCMRNQGRSILGQDATPPEGVPIGVALTAEGLPTRGFPRFSAPGTVAAAVKYYDNLMNPIHAVAGQNLAAGRPVPDILGIARLIVHTGTAEAGLLAPAVARDLHHGEWS